MEWLRSSRTFDRAPTGRVPTLAEQMTERQKMELELQNKLQVCQGDDHDVVVCEKKLEVGWRIDHKAELL